MARLSRHSWLTNPRLLAACFVGLPLGFAAFLCLFWFAVPYLLDSNRVIPTYIGFYIQYPYLFRKVDNLHCQTNGQFIDGASYFCRFNIKSSNIKQFAREMKLASGNSENCSLLHRYAPEADWWKPSGVDGGQCYSRFSGDYFTLLYSPTRQLAYINDSDY